jgi:halocin C8-like bacteriocin domain-containing protein
MSDKDMNRRSVLKGIGSAGAFGLGGSVSIQVAAADGTDPVTILNGTEAFSLARDLAQTSQFERLLAKANSLGYEFEWDATRLDAGRVEADELKREVVAYELDGTTEDNRAGIILARDLLTGALEFAQLDVEKYGDDGLMTEVERYELPVAGAGGLTASSGVGIEKRVMTADQASLRGLVDDIESTQGGVTTQQQLPDLPDVLNVSSCSGCYYAAKLLCRTVCGAFGGFVCGLLGISVVGGISCVFLVKAVCYIAEKATGCGDDVAATLCKSSGLNVCGPNEDGDIITYDIPYV